MAWEVEASALSPTVEGPAKLPGVPIRSNRVLRSRSLWLFQLEDEHVVMLSVEVKIDPPQRSFILLSSIVQEVQIIIGLFEVGLVLVNGLLASLGQRSPKPFYLCLKRVLLAFGVLLGLNHRRTC